MFSHRYDLSTHSDGLVSGVAEEVSVDGDGLPLPFISPPPVVPERNTAGIISGLEAAVTGPQGGAATGF